MNTRAASAKDLTTLSNPDEIKSVALKLKLEVEFNEKQLKGWAEHEMLVQQAGVAKAVFDTSSGLTVSKVDVDGSPASFKFLKPHKVFGTPLEVSLKPGLAAGASVVVRIYYSTSPAASACQWLPPEQTAGKRHPYLFTQCQAIHARSIFPCQDAPAVKVTYEALVTAPNWATVVMSALRVPEKEVMDASGRRTFVWIQPVPVSSYLVALAAGDLDSRDISPRVRVWAEPSVVESAAFEFSQTEEFLQIAEDLTMPYVWTRYDILCLPPSFPYGGMENPCCTFVTPTLLAGDRSLAGVVAHEISHSWSGNLVTNATWSHFWLNEGWTMWLERKIMTRINKEPLLFDLSAYCLGWKHLEEDIEAFKDHLELTALVPDLTDTDPDDAFSSVPYEKGFSLLLNCEQIVGAAAFEAFAKFYFKEYQCKTVTSEQFRFTLLTYFNNDKRLAALPWDDLFYKPGLPPMPKFNLSLARSIEDLADKWYDGTGGQIQDMGPTFAAWSTLQKQIFLERLLTRYESGPMSVPALEQLDAQCRLSATKNSEIRFRWNVLCLRAGAKFILPNTVDFITSQGRMKFTRSLYRELFKTSMGRELAVTTFKKHASFYHPICSKMVAADLGLKQEAGVGSGSSEEGKTCCSLACSSALLPALLVGGAVVAVAAIVVIRSRKT